MRKARTTSTPVPSRPSRRAARWLRVAAAVSVLAFASSASAYWLKVRRGGPEAILAAARKASTPAVLWVRYERDVLEDNAKTRIAIEVSRRPVAGGGSDVGVRVLDARGRLLAALALVDGRVTVRHGNAAPTQKAKYIFQPVAALGAPLALWAAIELTPVYGLRLEGEFKGTALLRMTPDYTSQRGLKPMKLGVSKRTLWPTVAEVIDLKGKPTARLLWSRPKTRAGLSLPSQLRIRSMGHAKPMDFVASQVEVGPASPAIFGAAALSLKKPARKAGGRGPATQRSKGKGAGKGRRN